SKRVGITIDKYYRCGRSGFESPAGGSPAFPIRVTVSLFRRIVVKRDPTVRMTVRPRPARLR
ncbi:MAG: hypothetical protein V3W18_09645, partial [candidate division Zixibacteria bacterium]